MREIESINVPQANTLKRVGDLLALVDQGIVEPKRLSKELGLVDREVLYYKDAARILGFLHVEKGRDPSISITPKGKLYLDARTSYESSKLLAAAVREAEVFAELIKQHGEKQLDEDKIVTFLHVRTSLNPTTAKRRADTILRWLEATREAKGE